MPLGSNTSEAEINATKCTLSSAENVLYVAKMYFIKNVLYK